MTAYAELQVTTNYSFLRGGAHADELVATAKALGLTAIGVADRNTLAGVVRAHVAAKREGLRLVVGARLDHQDGPSLICYPTDRAAYGRLCQLLTLGQRRVEGLERGPAGNTSLAAAFAIAQELDADQTVVVQETEYTGAGKHPIAQRHLAKRMGGVAIRAEHWFADQRLNVLSASARIGDASFQIGLHDYNCNGTYADPEDMVVIDFGPDRIQVAPPTQDAWRALASVLLHHDYDIRIEDTDSYNCRTITGGSGKSLHSYGIALDVNWKTNPFKSTPDKRKVKFSGKSTQAERANDVKRNGSVLKRYIDHALASLFNSLADCLGDFLCLAQAITDAALAVTDNHQCRKAETTSTFNNLRTTVDMDDAIGQLHFD